MNNKYMHNIYIILLNCYNIKILRNTKRKLIKIMNKEILIKNF